MLFLKQINPSYNLNLTESPPLTFHTCDYIKLFALQTSPGQNKLGDELQAAPLWVPGLSVSHEQNPFYNHFPLSFPVWMTQTSLEGSL